MNCRRKIQMIVMVSGSESTQVKALNTAIDTYPNQDIFDAKYLKLGKYNSILWEYLVILKALLDVKLIHCCLFLSADAKKQGWTSQQFCEHVKDCDIFIFVCHPVQADVPPPWDFQLHLRYLYDA